MDNQSSSVGRESGIGLRGGRGDRRRNRHARASPALLHAVDRPGARFLFQYLCSISPARPRRSTGSTRTSSWSRGHRVANGWRPARRVAQNRHSARAQDPARSPDARDGIRIGQRGMALVRPDGHVASAHAPGCRPIRPERWPARDNVARMSAGHGADRSQRRLARLQALRQRSAAAADARQRSRPIRCLTP